MTDLNNRTENNRSENSRFNMNNIFTQLSKSAEFGGGISNHISNYKNDNEDTKSIISGHSVSESVYTSISDIESLYSHHTNNDNNLMGPPNNISGGKKNKSVDNNIILYQFISKYLENRPKKNINPKYLLVPKSDWESIPCGIYIRFYDLDNTFLPGGTVTKNINNNFSLKTMNKLSQKYMVNTIPYDIIRELYIFDNRDKLTDYVELKNYNDDKSIVNNKQPVVNQSIDDTRSNLDFMHINKIVNDNINLTSEIERMNKELIDSKKELEILKKKQKMQEDLIGQLIKNSSRITTILKNKNLL
jgi:hypothetical protein